MNIKNIYLFYAIFLTISPSTYTIQNRGETLAAHKKQLENQLKNLNKKDRDTILRDFDQEMKSYTNDELANDNYIGQAKATIIVNYGKTKAELEARKYIKDQKAINDFAEQWNRDIRDKLFNNEPIDDIFDKKLEKAAHKHFTSSQFHRQHAYYNGTPPVQPKPSAPPVEINNYQYQKLNQPNHVYYVTSQQEKDRITKARNELDPIITFLARANISISNVSKFSAFFYESINKNPSIPITPPSPHVQNAFIKIFDNELDWLSIKLSQEISPSFLEKAIQVTRESLHVEIKKLTPQTAQRFQQILIGLEDTIRNNAGISCPICTETYKEHDKFGSVEKIILKSINPRELCQHALCKTCAKDTSIHNCPECRKSIDQQDLRQKLVTLDNPANWRP